VFNTKIEEGGLEIKNFDGEGSPNKVKQTATATVFGTIRVMDVVWSFVWERSTYGRDREEERKVRKLALGGNSFIHTENRCGCAGLRNNVLPQTEENTEKGRGKVINAQRRTIRVGRILGVPGPRLCSSSYAPKRWRKVALGSG